MEITLYTLNMFLDFHSLKYPISISIISIQKTELLIKENQYDIIFNCTSYEGILDRLYKACPCNMKTIIGNHFLVLFVVLSQLGISFHIVPVEVIYY